MNAKSLRQIRRDRREAQARARGYVGAWPPRWPTVNTPEQYEAVLCKLECGEFRASYVHTLGRRLVPFARDLTPGHFRRLARVLKAVVTYPGTAPRVRLRGIQAALRPLRDAAAILRRKPEAQEPGEWNHLEACMWVFLAELSDADVQAFTGVLTDLAAVGNPYAQLRAIRAAFGLILDDMALACNLEAAAGRA